MSHISTPSRPKKLLLTSLLSSITLAHASPNSCQRQPRPGLTHRAPMRRLDPRRCQRRIPHHVYRLPRCRLPSPHAGTPKPVDEPALGAERSACVGNPGKSASGSWKRVAGHLQHSAGSSGRSLMKSSIWEVAAGGGGGGKGAEVAAEGEEPVEGQCGDEGVLWVGRTAEERLTGGVGGGGEDKVTLAVQPGEGEDAVCGEGTGFYLGQDTAARMWGIWNLSPREGFASSFKFGPVGHLHISTRIRRDETNPTPNVESPKPRKVLTRT
ncbi:hypothetical protein B0H16DRAFT_1469486 [Mycena metata]|uniref:Uncharacterized protein n=1 Tax=Mycena metata TaxID=1033252 RepID=A0AAD7MSK2_9AGAR|nr:hypothetical protein B0H16DRAFT_1469486 [Mycena metata]